MKSPAPTWTRALSLLCAALSLLLTACEQKQVADVPAEDLKPLIHDVEVAADEFDRLWTEAKMADVAADLHALSTQPTMTQPPLLKAERENKMAEDARLKVNELSGALAEKLRAHPESREATAFFKRMEIRRKIEGLTADLAAKTDRDQIMDELRKARLELDALRPQVEKVPR